MLYWGCYYDGSFLFDLKDIIHEGILPQLFVRIRSPLLQGMERFSLIRRCYFDWGFLFEGVFFDVGCT